MYKTILVPFDGSKRAERILRHVEELAERCEAGLVLLTIVEPPAFAIGSEGIPVTVYHQEVEQSVDEAVAYPKALQGEFRAKGVEARTRVTRGPVVQAILDAAEEEDADLIALATHGRTGLSRVFHGSVAAGLLRGADRSQFLVRSQYD
ncbi:MAG: universal stress protein [Anaerolineae bacterium]|nr:universal stress protein [Anaerolineae bacterium]NIN94279.1 universal stress protein [Anaerolineae bacterium]NIQ77347.1 universal stress protein [Anaerolineae bacterium]